jgi:Na+/H+ antiporter
VEFALTLLAIAATVVAVAGLSARAQLPAPLVLLVVGVAGSYVPFIPEPTLSSEVVLVGLLPPLLYAAAIRTSLVDFRENRGTIGALSVGLVLFTAAGVALTAWWLLPIPFAVAFALGAIVAPPDAVAATAVARQIGLPRRIVTILEGESLLNDATALVSLRTAITAFSVAGGMTFWTVAGDFAWAVVGGVLVGLVVTAGLAWVRKQVTVPALDTAISFLAPFLAYLPAEELHASGVLAVVVTGILLGHKAPVLQTASSRLSERINWASVQFLLENAVFLLIGLQMRRIVSAAGTSSLGWGRILLASGAVLLAVLLLRPIWMLLMRLEEIARGRGVGSSKFWRHTGVASWAGMRGVVTLAAAFVLPMDTPQRDVLVLIAMVVAVGTILLQGLTLPWVARRLGVRGPDPREDALQEATILQRAVDAGVAALETADADDRTLKVVRSRGEDRVNRAWERLGWGADSGETPSESYRRVRLHMLAAERAELLRLRDAGTADQEVLSTVLGALDVEESMLDLVDNRDRTLRDAPLLPPELPGGGCEHLRAATCALAPTNSRVCARCIAEGLIWVHLRMCLTCGNIACCDSSIGRHATKHYHESAHPVMRSFEPGEAWRWCFVDQLLG